jgi:hypothetical protein
MEEYKNKVLFKLPTSLPQLPLKTPTALYPGSWSVAERGLK